MRTEDNDIRWVQRFENYKKAFLELEEEVALSMEQEISKLEKKGVIKSFEMVHELSWKVLKDFLIEMGHTNIRGSKDAFTMAGTIHLISEENVFILMESIKDRNQTIHAYDESETNKIFYHILESYFNAFKAIFDAMNQELKRI